MQQRLQKRAADLAVAWCLGGVLLLLARPWYGYLHLGGSETISAYLSIFKRWLLPYQVSQVDENRLQQCNSVAADQSQPAVKQFANVEKSWPELENTVLADSSSVLWSMPSEILWLASLKARGGKFGICTAFFALNDPRIGNYSACTEIDTTVILSNGQHMDISTNCLHVCKLSLTFVLKECLHFICTNCDVTTMQSAVIV
ncbi:hypothetical protein U9M48_001560 [Paspalum notatum var. saurae]|uniref:Uncharacterized protein n=1 Tax=Paspalum notatum var. saurae TaxID=547442 RepID=A0AAQ3PGJ5_PASNO